MERVTSAPQVEAARMMRRLLAIHRDNRDLVAIGAYKSGSDPELDLAVRMRGPIQRFLQQDLCVPSPLDVTAADLGELLAMSGDQAS
jgi:flagellum-specific ATP synthase